jgi:hypothetical protein
MQLTRVEAVLIKKKKSINQHLDAVVVGITTQNVGGLLFTS